MVLALVQMKSALHCGLSVKNIKEATEHRRISLLSICSIGTCRWQLGSFYLHQASQSLTSSPSLFI